MIDSICCKKLRHRPKSTLSPFAKILVLNWYDGPVEGVTACDVCSQCYRFQLLARVGSDPETKEEVFLLSPISASSFDQLVELFARNWKPSWPVWVPIGITGDSTLATEIEKAMDETFNTPISSGIAICTNGLESTVLDSHQIASGESPEMTLQAIGESRKQRYVRWEY